MEEEKKQNEEAQKELKVKDKFSIILGYKVNEDDVAPYVGAWIETWIYGINDQHSSRRTLCGCVD